MDIVFILDSYWLLFKNTTSSLEFGTGQLHLNMSQALSELETLLQM